MKNTLVGPRSSLGACKISCFARGYVSEVYFHGKCTTRLWLCTGHSECQLIDNCLPLLMAGPLIGSGLCPVYSEREKAN